MIKVKYRGRQRKLDISLSIPKLPELNPIYLIWIVGIVYALTVVIHLSNGFGLIRSLTGIFTDIRLVFQCPESFWDVINRPVISEAWGMLFGYSC